MRALLPVSLVLVAAAVTAQQSPPAAATPPLLHTVRGTVSGVDAEADRPVRLTLWLHDYHKEAATIVGDVRSAADGSFTFPDVPWLAGHEWGFAFYTLLARQGDRVAAVLLRGDQAARDEVAVALEPAITLQGRVTASNGHAIPDADVQLRGLMRGETWLYSAEAPPFWTTRSAADGSFAIRGVPPGWTYQLSFLADGYARGRLDQEAGAPFDVELEPGAVLTGRVLLPGGRPAVRVRVCAQGVDNGAWCTARTDEAGVYRLEGLPDDRYNVWADVEDHTSMALDCQVVEIGAETTAPDLQVVAGGFFVGRVIDVTTGEPVQPGDSADVAIYGPSRPRSGAGCHIAPIAADGTFRIRVSPGSNYIYLRAGPKFQALAPSDYTFDIAEGQEKVIEFRVRGPGGRAPK